MPRTVPPLQRRIATRTLREDGRTPIRQLECESRRQAVFQGDLGKEFCMSEA